ncbi:protein kinase domain-containing protein [Thiohalomonas denitrificans]|uniref:Serine/threonine protein kinase n=1 Tax=Thiohalomonas denitrificans TaxID=415747 RepID=A0A1G5PKU2_9GAMM|nr:protein kinase [Thiohalomonas denitrificans]SCZ50144.1 serine/threonine protein kinase [Thiohalomonas denitrificans]
MGEGPERRRSWLPGLLTLISFWLLTATPLAVTLETRLLAFAGEFVPPPESAKVMVVDADGLAPMERGPLLEQLTGAKGIGVMPSLALPGVGSELPLVHAGAFLSRSARKPPPLPEGIANWSAARAPAPVWPARVPGLITGRPPSIAWLDTSSFSHGAASAPADFPPGASSGRVPLVHAYGDELLPGFALRLVMAARGVNPKSPPLERSAIRLDNDIIETDVAYRVHPRLAQLQVAQHTAAEVLSGTIDVQDQVVLFGSMAPAAAEPVRLPDGRYISPLEAEARLVAALLGGHYWAVPPWSWWAHLGTFALAGVMLMLVLPRLGVTSGSILLALWSVVVFTAEFGLLVLKGIYTPLLMPGIAVLAGAPLLWFKARGAAQVGALRADLSLTNRLLAESYQAQGQLDAALERYRRCAPDEEVLDRLYGLGVDFERRRHFTKAGAVFHQIAFTSPHFRDVKERLQRNREAEQRMLGKRGSTTPSGTVILESAGLARPTLGRYELERELGRGAMGMVYLGRDPRIGRAVAIKTMALSQEFEGADLVTVRERFFREAETAGRLEHRHIVTIYDVGEEQELAYIAMDYLKGESLANWCRPDNLLPLDEVMAIGIQVAEALDYAHEQGVIHRDIKPANIIYDRDETVAKVTDFGVACLTDSSKTRTGTVLGSPSYMSPEQVVGKRLDGRSDLFSLGATLFQLLSGDLPFKSDSLPSLMYLIAKERHADIRSYRNLPACVSRLINKALHKEVGRRYQSGRTMAEALRRCRREAMEAAA